MSDIITLSPHWNSTLFDQNQYLSYWFLYSLFIYKLIDLSCQACMWLDNMLKSLCVHLMILLLFTLLYLYNKEIPYLLITVKMYPFYLLGLSIRHFKPIQELVFKNTRYIGVLLVVYIFLLIYDVDSIIHFELCGLFAVPILFNLFKTKRINAKPIQIVSKHTLEIYLIHWFFLPTIHSVAVINMFHNPNNIVLLFIASTCVALPIVFICIVVSQFIHNYKSASLFFLGNR